MSLLSIQNVGMEYDGKTILDDVTLDIEGKSSMALLGPNGSGKTTLLRILASIERPTSGRILYKGQPLDDRETLRRECTMVFQTPTMFDSTVNYNVAFGLRLRRLNPNQIRERVREALSKVDLDDYGERMATKLSGGEQQRVSIARALALRPRILLLDEPTSNLDPRSVAKIESIMERIRQEDSVTMILATHRIDQAERICDRIAVLVDGRIVRQGSFPDVLASKDGPLRDYAYFGANLFTGRVLGREKGLAKIGLPNDVVVFAATPKEGDVTVRIGMEDIVISLGPVDTSARNVIPAQIVGFTDRGSSVVLHADAGVRFLAQITHQSYAEMGLGPGSKVFLVFKASSVEVL